MNCHVPARSEQSHLKRSSQLKSPNINCKIAFRFLKVVFITLRTCNWDSWGRREQINIGDRKTQFPTFTYVIVSYRSGLVLEALLILNAFPIHSLVDQNAC